MLLSLAFKGLGFRVFRRSGVGFRFTRMRVGYVHIQMFGPRPLKHDIPGPQLG